MVGEIKTIEERKEKLLALGKKQGHITYEQLAEELKGLDIDSDTLDELYNTLMDAEIEIVSEDGGDDASGEEITEDLFTSYLDTAGIPDPDLMIRTSGEERISNFMMWQLAYTELYFTDVLWPDFNREELIKAIEYFNGRDRRFGAV